MPLQSDSTIELPFIFTCRDHVYGTGLLAEVRSRGRVLAVEEADGVWMYGVNPGDIAASGATRAEAHAAFRKSYSAVLFDIAEEAKDFEDFKAQVEQFFNQANGPVLAAWKEAVEARRKNHFIGGTSARDMDKLPAETPLQIDVVMKKQADFTTDLNELDPEPVLAA